MYACVFNILQVHDIPHVVRLAKRNEVNNFEEIISDEEVEDIKPQSENVLVSYCTHYYLHVLVKLLQIIFTLLSTVSFKYI